MVIAPDSILIYAAGKGTRWNRDIPKQLVEVEGQPLMVGTYKQAYNIFGRPPKIIGNRPEMAGLFPAKHYYHPPDHDCLAEALLVTRNLWIGRVIILLGDTYYEDYTLEMIKEDDQDLMFYGRLLEIYAVSFKHYLYFDRVVQGAVKQFKNGIGNGKLWHLWYLANGYPVDEHTLPDVANPFFQQLNPNSVTMDIDTWEDYLILKEKLGEPVHEYA